MHQILQIEIKRKGTWDKILQKHRGTKDHRSFKKIIEKSAMGWQHIFKGDSDSEVERQVGTQLKGTLKHLPN